MTTSNPQRMKRSDDGTSMLRATRLLFLNVFILKELCLQEIILLVWNAQQLLL